MRTAVTDMFGIDVPILAFTHCRDVVAAVTKAGGMGVLGAVAHTPEQLEIDLKWIEAEVGDRPYGVDLIVPAKYAGSDQGGLTMQDIVGLIPQEHRDFVHRLLEKYEVPPLPDSERGSNSRSGGDLSGTAAPFSAAQADPLLEIALAHQPRLLVNALGPPPAHMIDRVKQEGRLIGALAGKAQHAQRHVQAGVDLIIAQGAEAGGHTGEVGTMVLVPEVVDAVAPVPVLGAGGIGRGRQMAAAMALGAAGVWCGSVWLTTEEAETHPVVKQKFLAATSSDTLRVAIAHGQAGPATAVGVDRRVGRPGQSEPARHAPATHPRRRGQGPHRACLVPSRQRSRTVGELLRGAGGGQHEHREARSAGGVRHDRRVHRVGAGAGFAARGLSRAAEYGSHVPASKS